MKRKYLGLSAILLGMAIAMGVLLPHPAYAKTCDTNDSILPKWYKYMNVTTGSDGECVLKPSFPYNIPRIALAIVDILLRIAGIMAMIYVIYGGFQYLISTGEPDKIKGARTTIINALIGMMIAILATAIVNFVGRNIAQ